MYNNSIELSKTLLIKYLGEPIKIRGHEHYWQCPLCRDNGCDTKKDNLQFNDKKNILYCFANPNHSRYILQDIYKRENSLNKSASNLINYTTNFDLQNTKKENNEIILSPEKLELFKANMIRWNKWLLEDELCLKTIEMDRGINKDTISEVMMGYDASIGRLALPTVKYNTTLDKNEVEIIGFEYRRYLHIKGIKKISREPGTPSYLAMINMYNPKTEILAVVEGYYDGYALFQYLNEKGQIDYYHIVTCSNGVHSLLRQLSAVNFSKYKKYNLFIDNDEAGRQAAEKIIKEYPQFSLIIPPDGSKDFNEYYLSYKEKLKEEEKKKGGN